MLDFLTTLFGPAHGPDETLLDGLLDTAIERAIDKTDHRLRALGGYRKRLQEPVERALHHVIGLVDRLPEPIEISPGHYGHDPRLRAVFASAEHMADVLGRFQNIRDYLERRTGPPPDDIFGLLAIAQKERRQLGMELDGDRITRDVLQTVITFEDHQYLAPSDSEASARTELTTLGFDFLLQQARETIAAHKTRRGELARKRQLLRRRLFSPVTDPSNPIDLESLEADIALIDEELGYCGGIELSLEESLRHVETILGEADKWLAVNPFRVALDYRNVQTPSSEAIEMSEVSSANGTRRIVLFGRLPRQQLPEPKNMLKLCQAYLG